MIARHARRVNVEMWQYRTKFSCPDCGEHVLQTDADVRSGADFAGAECTNCGYALSAPEIARQLDAMTANDAQNSFTR